MVVRVIAAHGRFLDCSVHSLDLPVCPRRVFEHGSVRYDVVRVNRLEPGRESLRSLQAVHNPFRYFNSSPEVIRLAVMLYIRYPLSLRQVEDILFERGIGHMPRDGAFVVEPLWADVRRRDQEAAHSSSVILAVALASGRGCAKKAREGVLT